MNFRLQLTKAGIQELQKAIQTARKRGQLAIVQRASAILLLHEGNLQSVVARCFGVSVRTIRRWLATFLSKGLKGLQPKKPKGRPSRLTKTQKRKLVEQIQESPETYGYSTGVWDSALIQDHIKRQFGVSYSVFYISQLLRNLGCSYIKPKSCYASKPEDFQQQLVWIREEFPALYAQAQAVKGILYFLDESTFQLQCNAVKTWTLKGAPPLLMKNPKRGSLKVLGAIDLFSGQLTYQFVEGRLNNQAFVGFLKRLATKHRGKDVFVVMDNAPYHQGPAQRKYLAHNKRMHVVRLPARSPHLNPIEKLWKELKKNRTHNRYFANKQELRSALTGGFRIFQRDRERVKQLMSKWESAGQEPQAARRGEFDSSFIPDKYKAEGLLAA